MATETKALLTESKDALRPKSNKRKYIAITVILILIISITAIVILVADVFGLFEDESQTDNNITSEDIITLREELRQAIDDSTTDDGLFGGEDPRPLLAAIVRLIFHDCSGRNIIQSEDGETDLNSTELTINRCNGCLDFDEPDNGGIWETAVDPLESIYTSNNGWEDKMSRADFWAAAGIVKVHINKFYNKHITPTLLQMYDIYEQMTATIAIEYAAELQWEVNQTDPLIPNFEPTPLPDIPFYFGREDCPNSPNAIERDVFHFPDSHAGWIETKTWFEDNLGMNERQTVLLLGAHTLGQARPQFLGHIDAWVGTNNALNVEYYQNMQFSGGLINVVEWQQKAVADIPGAEGFDTDRYQWVIGNAEFFGPLVGRGIMLNSDMALVLNFTNYLDRETGIISCTAPTFMEQPFPSVSIYNTTCPPQEGIWQMVDELAGDNGKFVREFAEVFELMLTYNEEVSELQKLVVEYDRSFEQ